MQLYSARIGSEIFKYLKLYWIFILLAVLAVNIVVFIYLQLSKAAVSSYDFSGITNPSGTHVARIFEVDVDFPTNGALTIDTLTDDGTTSGTPQIRSGIAGYGSDTEATNTQYTTISSSDDSHWQTPDPGFGDSEAFWAQFDIAETPANITQIDILIEGYQGGIPPAGRNAWLGVWVADAPTPYWKTLESSQHTSDHDFTGTISSNIPDYIDANGKLTIILYNEDQHDSLYIDYVNIDVTYSAFVAPPAMLSAQIDDPDNGDRKLSAGDTLTIKFDKATNAPPVATKADIDGLISFPQTMDLDAVSYDHIIGADYSGVWSTETFADDTLTITVNNGIVVLADKEVELKAGETISIKADGTNDLKDDTGSSSASVSSIAITGNWGLRPDDDVTYASDHNANAQIFEVTLIDEYHYNHASPYIERGDLTYVGFLPISTYAIGRRPIDGFIYAAENGAANGKLAWMNPEKKASAGQSPDGYDPSTGGNPFAYGIIGDLGPGVEEFYRLVFTASGILYGASNNNKLYRVYDSIQIGAPPGTHGAADNLAGTEICTIQADGTDPPAFQLATGGSADFAFDSEGKLFLISHDILYWIETGPLVGGIITAPCTAHAIGDTGLNQISGLAFTKGGQMHVSTFLPDNRELSTVDPEDADVSDTSAFDPDQDIYDLGSVPKWTDIEITKTDGGLEFSPGDNITYTITVENAADPMDPNLSDARGPIFVRDTLPEGLDFVSASGVDWTCDHVGQLIECVNQNNIAKGVSLPVITVVAEAQDNGAPPDPPYEAPEPVVFNTACVDSTTFEEFDVEDCDTESTPIGEPELSITKTPSDNIVNPGQDALIYTVSLKNTGTITGTGIQISDPITDPPLNAYLENLRNVIAVNCGHLAETTIKVKGTELKSGEDPIAANIVIDGTSVSVDIPDGTDNTGIASAIASAINAEGTHHAYAESAIVTIYHGTQNTASNGKTIDTSALVTAIDTADITDDDTELPAPAFSGATDITDNSTASEVIIDDIVIGPFSRTAQECIVEYTVDIKDSVAGGTIIENRADATAPAEGGSAVFDTADVTVSNSPIMSPVKTDDDPDDIVLPAQTVTYTLTIDNIGNLDGTGVDIDDTLDSDMENLSVVSLTDCGVGYTDNSTANPSVLNIDDVAVTTASNCIIVFTADVKAGTSAGAIIPNTANISAADEGGLPTSASSDDLVVTGAPSLVGTKTHNKGSKDPPNEVDPGELVTYTLTIDNIGDTTGTGIEIDDVLDTSFEGLNVVSLTDCGVGYTDNSTADPPVLDIDGVAITSADDCVIVFEATVKAGTAPGTVIPNTASASPATEGGTGDPDILAVDLQVPGTVAITTAKADNDADNIVDPDQLITYTVTLHNDGDVKLTGIHLLDTMDSDLRDLNVLSITDCGSNYLDQSSANPPELDIRGAGGDPDKGLEVSVGTDCIVTFTSNVDTNVPGNATIPNVASVTESKEGAGATSPASDVLTASMPSVSAIKVDDDADDLVNRSQVVTYTITLSNTGTGARSAYGVDIYDAMDGDYQDLGIESITDCGTAYIDSSMANPPVIDIDDLEILNGTDCIIEVKAQVKPLTPGGSTLPNTVTFSASDEGAPGGAASSDLLIVPIICGDGFKEGTETCDDGNLVNGDGCEDDCTLPPPPAPAGYCGDGAVNGTEDCDDGNNISGDGCSSVCTREGSECTGNCGPPDPPPPKTCFEYDPYRDLQFGDLDKNTDAYDYIITLKNSKIRLTGDYIISGNDNHSTGKQQKKYKSGLWDYQPKRNVRRMEAIKAILVSNCIPIEDEVPIPEDGYEFIDVPHYPDPDDDLMSFTSRVIYTAYKHGVITKSQDDMAYPFQDANLVEVLAIGLRTTKALTKEYLKIEEPWYKKYFEFAKDKAITAGIEKYPDAKIKRDDFAKIIFRLMWHNPRSRVYSYIRQFDFFDYKKLLREDKDPAVIEPVADTDVETGDVLSQDELKPSAEEKASRAGIASIAIDEALFNAGTVKGCLVHNPKRPLDFIDVPKDHWAYVFIEMLRTTRIEKSGDYIASGHGNPSAGNEMPKYMSGDWEYRPEDPVTFLELVKTAMISNCIPIDEEISAPADGFRFSQLPVNISPRDEMGYFVARVMYTAYRKGIIKGDVAPFLPVSRFQAITILSRVTDIIPEGYVPGQRLPFTDTDDNAWYSQYVSFLYERGLVKGFPDNTFRGGEDLKRAELAKFINIFMRLNKNEEIRQYGEYIANFYDANKYLR